MHLLCLLLQNLLCILHTLYQAYAAVPPAGWKGGGGGGSGGAGGVTNLVIKTVLFPVGFAIAAAVSYI